MRQRTDGVPPLTAITPTEAEQARMEALLVVAQALTEHPGFGDRPLVVKGGTALAQGQFTLVTKARTVETTLRASPLDGMIARCCLDRSGLCD